VNLQKPPHGIEWWQTWSQDLAYVLGFAFADGAVARGRNSLVLSQAKPQILESIQKVIPSSRLSYSEGAKVWRLAFYATGLNRILLPYGIVPNKTHYGYWPLEIPTELVPHYIRGYFDGDGSISHQDHHTYSIRFVCHLESYLKRLSIELLERRIRCHKMLRDKNNWRLGVSSADVLAFRDLIYTDANLYLQRKRDIFSIAAEEIAKGRAKGVRCHSAKITDNDVIRIRQLYREGKWPSDLAQEYGIGAGAIRKIVRGETWKHVSSNAGLPAERTHSKPFPGTKNSQAKLTEDKVRRIRELYQTGRSYASLAKLFQVSKRTIANIITYKNWRHVE
jgi:hypothetical protein